VNHLLIADDSLLFFKANGEGATEISESLNLYCMASDRRSTAGNLLYILARVVLTEKEV
jgi:hypothetical protein